jgi:GH15 family glucan-1,4-alpha-glucosidase
MMIPEQVWDRAEVPRASLDPGEGTGSATPLAWSMAQFLRLAVNLSQAKNIETPAVTKARYLESPAKK